MERDAEGGSGHCERGGGLRRGSGSRSMRFHLAWSCFVGGSRVRWKLQRCGFHGCEVGSGGGGRRGQGLGRYDPWRCRRCTMSMTSVKSPSGIQENSTCIEVAGHRITAVSVGSWETCIQLPSYRLAIDIGRCPPSAVNMDTVAFTHMHVDHIGGIGMHVATRSMRKMSPPTYILPPGASDDFAALIRAFEKLDGSAWNFDLHPLPPGAATYSLGRGRVLRSYKTFHTVPSQGYLVYTERKKLLDEYRDLRPEEIGRLRLQGKAVSSISLVPEVAVPGDTTIDVLAAEEDVRTAKVLVIEITFLDDSVTVEDARRFGHIHLDEVVEKAELFQNEAVVFTHFSARYSAEEIRQRLRERLPDSLYQRTVALAYNHKSALRSDR